MFGLNKPKKKKLILHIGRHKSGTSSLQHHFATNQDFLAEQSILYPQTGRKGVAHHALFHEALATKAPRENIARFREELAREAADYDTVLISSEGFQNINQYDRVRELFSDYRIHAIGYIREIVDYLASAYAQYVHFNTSAVSFAYFSLKFQVDLRAYVLHWRKLADECDFVVFERDRLINRDIIDDFCERAGLPLGVKSPADRNPSISGGLLHFKLLANAARLQDPSQYGIYAGLAVKHKQFGGRFYIDPEVTAGIRRRPYNQDIRRLLGEAPTERDFSLETPMFDPDRWPHDLKLICEEPILAAQAEAIAWLANPKGPAPDILEKA